jgi:hypothetical protein
MVIFELRFLPYVWARPNGNPRRPDGWSNLPLNWIWKESEAERSLRGVRTGCWDVRMDASWNSSFSKQWRSRRECTSSGQMMLNLSRRPNGVTRRPNGWNSGQMGVRTGWHVVRTTDRDSEIFCLESSAETSKPLLNNGIPCKTASLQTNDFVQTQDEANYKLTNSPFGHSGTKITWPVWKYILGPNQKLLPLFVTKG